MLIGESIIDAVTIGIILALNTVIGFVQEYRAEKALEALKSMVTLKAKVVRDGKETIIEARDIVPGDIILLEEGDKIPADARVIEAIDLYTNEAVLTSEFYPVKKTADKLPREVGLADRINMVFMGTYVVRGRGKAITVATGMSTEFGRIAGMVREVEREKTPLKRKLSIFAKKLAALIAILTVIIFIIELYQAIPHGIDPIESAIEALLVSIALAVSAVPEGLPVVLTVTLAIGARNLAKRNAIIRRLSSAETLVSVTVIASDKTGTITRGEMTVRYIWVNDSVIMVEGTGYAPKGRFLLNDDVIYLDKEPSLSKLLTVSTLCTKVKINNGKIIGDPTEAAIYVLALKAGLKREVIERSNPRVGEIPFTSEWRMMSTVHEYGKNI